MGLSNNDTSTDESNNDHEIPLKTGDQRTVQKGDRVISLPRDVLGDGLLEPGDTLAILTNERCRQLTACMPENIDTVVAGIGWRSYDRHDNVTLYSQQNYPNMAYQGSVVLPVPSSVSIQEIAQKGDEMNCLFSTYPPMVTFAYPDIIDARILILDALQMGVSGKDTLKQYVVDHDIDEETARIALECENVN